MSHTNLFKELNAIADGKYTKDSPEHKELWLMLYQAAQFGIASVKEKPNQPTVSTNKVIAYVVADNNGSIHGVKLVEADANKLRDDKQLDLEMAGSLCRVTVRKFTT